MSSETMKGRLVKTNGFGVVFYEIFVKKETGRTFKSSDLAFISNVFEDDQLVNDKYPFDDELQNFGFSSNLVFC